MEITKDITIEELTETVAASVKYLMEEGIRCIVCGEPIWGTLEEAAKEKGFTDTDIERFVKDLQALANNPEEEKKKTGTVINVEKLNKNK
jgi:methionine synthase II (cobalamin-independent)